jgi:DNA modification methylase
MLSEDHVNRIYPGDCVQVMNSLPEKSVDVVFADPPYNLQLQQELYRPNMTRFEGVTEGWDQFKSLTEYDDFTRSWLSACRRVLKDTGTLWVIGSYHNIYRVGAILMDLGFWILNDVVWVKLNPPPNFRGVRFTNAHETLLWVQKTKGAKYTFNYRTMKAINGGLQMRSDWHLPICTGAERIKVDGQKAHPTQKPEALLERVILSSSNPGDVILDPFLGTGTTGAVAKRLGRHWIGVEQEAQYMQVAQARIDAVIPDTVTVHEIERNAERVPFKQLLAAGLLEPDQALYFKGQSQQAAIILPDGSLQYGEITGSIHGVGKTLQGAPCNGWENWYYEDAQTGQLEAIDKLRQMIREKTNGFKKNASEAAD